MAAINATSFLLLKDQTVLGHSSSTVINLQQDLADATTKDSNGWQEFLAGIRSGIIRAEGLTDYSDSLNFGQLQEMLITRSINNFFFKQPLNEKFIFRGNGFVTNVSEVAEREGAVSFNVEIQLTGLYVITDPNLGQTWDTIFVKWEELQTAWENV
jgi:predicted secreted protein